MYARHKSLTIFGFKIFKQRKLKPNTLVFFFFFFFFGFFILKKKKKKTGSSTGIMRLYPGQMKLLKKQKFEFYS